MKILWVKAGKLLPLDTGGKIRSYNILRHLGKAHEVVFLSYYGGPRDAAYECQIAQELPGSLPVHCRALPVKLLPRALDYIRRLPDPAPFVVANYAAREVQDILHPWIAERRFDVAICDFLAASLNFPAQLNTPCVLFQHNVESILWERKARHETSLIRGAAWRLEARKMKAYETSAVARFHRVIAVSQQDREYMREMTDPDRIDVVPTGVDLRQFSNLPRTDDPRPLVAFVGSMDWRPNIDAVQYFCRDIWPQILATLPQARFRVVGRTPPKEIQRLASDTVEITGTVPSVVDHLQEAAVIVVPLRIGGGTRLKIYEAMAAGKAVVSTSIGAEGLDVADGNDILLADTPGDFSTAVVRLLQDRVIRRSVEDAAVRKAALYDWSVISRRFADVLQNCVRFVNSGSNLAVSEAALHA